jgi:transcriptional regulator with XRE-family HTH domain
MVYILPVMADDPVMAKVRQHFEKSGLTLHQLGLKMGYADKIARQASFQFMKAGDPRISVLRRFAKAMRIPIEELVSEKKNR